MRLSRNQRGFTLQELMIGMVISFVVVMGLGYLVVANLRTWEWNQTKLNLQQNVTESLEWMSRSIRESSSVLVVSATEFRTYDGDANMTHAYRLNQAGVTDRLEEDGQQMAPWECTAFSVSCNSDTSSIVLDLEYTDTWGNSVAAMTRSTLRNSD